MVNIQDIENFDAYLEAVPENVDGLEFLFGLQKRLMAKYAEIERENIGFEIIANPYDDQRKFSLHTHRDQFMIKAAAYRVIEEISEATNCLKCKPWKSTPVPTDVDHFYEELVDALHFFIELLILCGIDSRSKVLQLYLKKYAVNKFRQRSNY